MSVAIQKFSERISPTLLKKGSVGIGPLLPHDVGRMFTWMNDIESNSMDLPYRPTDGAAFAGWLSTLASDPTRVLFAIHVAGNTSAAGFLILQNIQQIHRSADLGIRVGQECDRGHGIGKAAVALGLDYAWDHLNLARVQLRVQADNTRAIAAYTAAGFSIEGRHLNAAYVAGCWHDMLTMAALNPRKLALPVRN